MKRIFGFLCYFLLFVGFFAFQTTTSFAASAHTHQQAAPLGNAGGTLVRGSWISSTTFAFLANDIQSRSGHIEVYQGSQTVGVAYFGSANSQGYVIGTVSIGLCSDPNNFYWSARVFDGQAGPEFPQTIASCKSFTPPPYGPDTCINGYVWRGAYSGDHVCVTTANRDQASNDNSQAASRVNPNGLYGPDTCINGYVWREASKGINPNIVDHVCVTLDTRAQASNDNSQAVYRKLDLGF